MAETEGTGATSYTPTADVDFKPLEIDVNSVAELGKALVDEAQHFGDAAKPVLEQMADPSGERGMDGGYSVGVDPTQETLRNMSSLHSERMTDMGAHSEAVQTGLRNLGRVTQAITAQFGSQDSLNSASLEDVRAIIYGSGGGLPSNPEQDA